MAGREQIPGRDVRPTPAPAPATTATPAPAPAAAPVGIEKFAVAKMIVLGDHRGVFALEGVGGETVEVVLATTAPVRTVVEADYPPVASGRAPTTRRIDNAAELARYVAEYRCEAEIHRGPDGVAARVLLRRPPAP